MILEAVPFFDHAFRQQLETLCRWRRDVRHFRADAVDPALLADLLRQACLAPSVGNSQPWRFVLVEAPWRRAAVRRSFLEANAEAAQNYASDQARRYKALKLSGLDEAPVHLAVCCADDTTTGHGLGRQTMPETLRYSVVAAIHTLWLAARAHGLGMGWVSILDPTAVLALLSVPPDWSLVGYFCLGYPREETIEPELARAGWQERRPVTVLRR
ncbi:cob(II)yrinic acid a,c-diamide reductase [Arboricoccus pini]|uniref:Cob(II)yrinic acid a,c-diamide reductase n=1 Tax=Arboricoccus pini TaxID=1963835 RepID=A0A212REB5_9PROT|nr:5,6-dimethylbenzimidazole synthase [Arboricoccus pini]SNB70505.1 cob(II)yrinic acid a,c-diamide reductase [Arboricoccus pini]